MRSIRLFLTLLISAVIVSFVKSFQKRPINRLAGSPKNQPITTKRASSPKKGPSKRVSPLRKDLPKRTLPKKDLSKEIPPLKKSSVPKSQPTLSSITTDKSRKCSDKVLSEVKRGTLLGKGSFGSVYLATYGKNE